LIYEFLSISKYVELKAKRKAEEKNRTGRTMSDKFVRVTGTFGAKGNDGREYVIYVFTQFLGTTGEGANKQSVLGETWLATLDDRHVVKLGKGRYLIESLGVELETDAQNAP
jgi:hypothetical protein